MKTIPCGVYPVMITPYNQDNSIDYGAVDAIVDYYYSMGCHGIFAVCQSSEMFFLSENERAQLAERVVRASAGRMCVVASGHTSAAFEDQVRELKRIQDAGVDAVVMISSLLARRDQGEDVAIGNMKRLLDALPDADFGMYECPMPYKRLLSDDMLIAMADSGRFSFIKDTCCNAQLISHRLQLAAGRVQIFNANAETFYDTLLDGASGFSGIMANYHADLYVWLIKHYLDKPILARKVAAFLALFSSAEGWTYPVNAKYHMGRVGVPMEIISRVCDCSGFMDSIDRHAVDTLITAEQAVRDMIEEDT